MQYSSTYKLWRIQRTHNTHAQSLHYYTPTYPEWDSMALAFYLCVMSEGQSKCTVQHSQILTRYPYWWIDPSLLDGLKNNILSSFCIMLHFYIENEQSFLLFSRHSQSEHSDLWRRYIKAHVLTEWSHRDSDSAEGGWVSLRKLHVLRVIRCKCAGQLCAKHQVSVLHTASLVGMTLKSHSTCSVKCLHQLKCTATLIQLPSVNSIVIKHLLHVHVQKLWGK